MVLDSLTSPLVLVALVVALLLLPAGYTWYSAAFDLALRKIPGPWYTPYTRLVLKYHVLAADRYSYIHRLHEKYGPTVRIAPREVVVSDIQSFRQIHRVGSDFTKARDFYQTMLPDQIDDNHCGVFMLTDVKRAAQRRKYFLTAGRKEVVREWEDLIADLARNVAMQIRTEAERGVADICKWWSFMTADVLGLVAFGEPFDMVKTGKKNRLMEDVEMTMLAVGVYQEMYYLWKVLEWIPIPAVQEFVRIHERGDVYGEQAVRNTKMASKSSHKTFFAKMYPEGEEQPFPDSLITKESFNIIVAGVDTTTIALTYCVYEILREQNQSIRQRLSVELDALPGNPSWDDLNKAKLLCNVIEETLRLHTPVPGALPRNAPAGGATLGGYFVPGGTIVETQSFTFHMNPAIWSAPER